jgi:hypothetical protein
MSVGYIDFHALFKNVMREGFFFCSKETYFLLRNPRNELLVSVRPFFPDSFKIARIIETTDSLQIRQEHAA